MKKVITIFGLVLSFSFFAYLIGRSFRPGEIPNGFTNTCANCHINPAGGGPRNVFGQEVEANFLSVPGENGHVMWGPDLAALDSDGDGKTNGEELQDPNGLWKIGDPPPGDPNLVTLPGVPDVTGIDDNLTPNKFALLQNYPNPFNPSTTIEYIIPQNSFVSLKIYNITGREIKTLVNSQQSAGANVAVWNGKDKRGNSAASGMYLYRISAAGRDGKNIAVRKMMLLK